METLFVRAILAVALLPTAVFPARAQDPKGRLLFRGAL